VNPLPFIAGGDCFGRMGTTRGSYGLTSLTTFNLRKLNL
jgi:hypothetical protein